MLAIIKNSITFSAFNFSFTLIHVFCIIVIAMIQVNLPEHKAQAQRRDSDIGNRFTWLRHVGQYNRDKGTAASISNYIYGFFLAVASHAEAAFSKRPYQECFQRHWTEKPVEMLAPSPFEDLEAQKIEGPQTDPQKSRYSKKRLALGLSIALVAGFVFWRSGALEGARNPIADFLDPEPKPFPKEDSFTPDLTQTTLGASVMSGQSPSDGPDDFSPSSSKQPSLFDSPASSNLPPSESETGGVLPETSPMDVSGFPPKSPGESASSVERPSGGASGGFPTPHLLPEQITIFTSYTTEKQDRLKMSRLVEKNQKAYCQRYGYKYIAYEENLADSLLNPSLAYWSKIAGINRFLEAETDAERPSWVVWLDDDAIVLNGDNRMEKFILGHGGSDQNVHVIVTKDVPHAQTELNTGVLMVRNSDTSRKFFKELWDRRHTTNRSGYPYSTCPAQICLHEQEAMHDLIQENPSYREFVKIIPQTDISGIGINTFERFNHYDFERTDPNTGQSLYLDYGKDPQGSKCKDDAFICQCTGLAIKGTRHSLKDVPTNLRLECIESLLEKAK